ncbi:hypothetical protein B0H66DRAFT_468953 [Apodospora peruviana]|uniref:Uncharacterized protein n=1 Tax=Apodospora peruviana TaxID=516989 RepID=A0AAE0MG19_9PEZI|nr:hypothetical protein B0H66DRAFT_468953 [Apodospora peruviana]
MSSLYVSPPETGYLLNKPFDMPAADGTVWAVAFSTKTGQTVNAALSVAFTFIFTWFWGLVAAAALYFAPHRFSRRRLVALIALRNSSDPWSAFQALLSFTTESMGCFRPRRQGQPSTWRDSLFGLVFVTLALAVVVTSMVLGIFGPPMLQIGNVAPVSVGALYYPRAAISRAATYRAFRVDPSLRALSSVEVFGETVRSKVVVQPDATVQTVDESEPMYGLTYGYSITGAELGLKHSSDLALSVKGACRTEYGWLDTKNDDETLDRYFVFNDPNNKFTSNLTGPVLSYPPRTGFILPNQDEANVQAMAGNVSYAVLATLAHRPSARAGTDPWYLTERWDEGNDETPFRIRPRRPALSCWHQDTWSCCGGDANHTVTGGLNLPKLTSLGIPNVLRDVLGIALLYPPVWRIGQDAGMSALTSVVSSPGSIDGTLDASTASIHRDMERLVMGAYINTLNTLADSTMFQPASDEEIRTGGVATPRDGADDFVVHTPDAQTFNLSGLIATTCIVGVLLIFKLILMLKLSEEMMDPNLELEQQDSEEITPRFNKDRWARFRAFSAVNLLRNTYEDGTGVAEDDWRCSESLPDPKEEKLLRLVRCGHGDHACAGHIATDPELLGLGRQQQLPRKRQRRHHVKNVNSVSTLLGEDVNYDSSATATVKKMESYGSLGRQQPQQHQDEDFGTMIWSPTDELGTTPGNGFDDSRYYMYGQGNSSNPYFRQVSALPTPPAAQENGPYEEDITFNSVPLLEAHYYQPGK